MASKVTQAKQFAKKYHKNDIRLSGETQYDHTLRVFNKLEDANVKDDKLLISTLLHHVLDDNTSAYEDLSTRFGKEVADLVLNFNRLTQIHIRTKAASDINYGHIINTFLSMAQDLDAMVIRFADKSDNVETSYVFPKDPRNRIANRALHLYAPICKFLGLNTFVQSMENESFKILQPADYYHLSQHMDSINGDIIDFFADAKQVLLELLEEHSINAEIKSRLKHEYSLHIKSLRKGKSRKTYKDDKSKHFDVAALRLIVDHVADCYIAEDILSGLWSDVPEDREDYIQNPKPNGYKSIHGIYDVHPKFLAEFQIRTREMHDRNEYGLASHTFYKMGNKFRKKLQGDPDWLKKLNYWEREHVISSSVKPEKAKLNKIYVFTPKGDIKELVKGATIVDFAYSLHAEVGNSCVGASINGENAKISTELFTGDTVSLKLDRKRTIPSVDWLQFVKTAKARLYIKKALKHLY